MIDAQDATGKFPDLEERLPSAESAPEEPTGVLWEQGPVELPVETLPELAPAESPIPPPDPAFAAVVVELPEVIPEVGAEDVEEIVEELRTTRVPERAGRAQDHYERNAMQKLRAKGFM